MCGQNLQQLGLIERAPKAARAVTPNLAWYDWIVVNSSAGKDSQAMLDEVVRLARGAGVLGRVVVVHADLGRVEWAGTKELAAEQAAHYGLPFFMVSRPQGDLLDHVRQRAAAMHDAGHHAPPWFSSAARYCTSDHKRGQVRKLLTALAKKTRDAGVTRRVRILNCMGLRAQESSRRQKLLPFRLDRPASNGRRTVHTWLPIHAWTAGEVWARIRQSGVRHHKAYDLGMPRLSCCFCVFAPKAALMLAGKHNPGLLEEYVELEREVGWAFRPGLALADLQAELAAGCQPGEIKTWEM